MSAVLAPALDAPDLSKATTPRFPLVERNFSMVSDFLIALSQSASGSGSGESRAFWPAGTIRQLLVACTELGSERSNAEATRLAELAQRDISVSTGVLGPGLADRDQNLERIFSQSVDLLRDAARAGKPAMDVVDQVVSLILPHFPHSINLLTGRPVKAE